MKKMKKSTAVKKKPTTKTARKPGRRGMRGGSIGGAPRKCGVCQKKGHNRRSHEPGRKHEK